MATLNKAIKKQPIQAILAGITIFGVVVSLLNFYLLVTISPIETRVMALEKLSEDNLPFVSQFIEVKTNVLIIKEDIRDIKNYLNIR